MLLFVCFSQKGAVSWRFERKPKRSKTCDLFSWEKNTNKSAAAVCLSVCLSCHRFASLSARCDCFDCRVMTFSMTDDYCVTDDVTASAPAANTRHNSTTIGTVQWRAWCDTWYTKGHASWQGSLTVPSLDSKVVSLPTVMSVWSLKMQLKKVFGCGGDMPHPLWRLATSTPSPTQLIVNNSRTLHGRVITDEAIAEVSTM